MLVILRAIWVRNGVIGTERQFEVVRAAEKATELKAINPKTSERKKFKESKGSNWKHRRASDKRSVWLQEPEVRLAVSAVMWQVEMMKFAKENKKGRGERV